MAERQDLSGKQIGRYHVLAVLGSGGMGTVYEAIDPTLGRHIALKVLPPLTAADAGRLNRFVQEAKAASALNHPHLISIYEIGTSQSDDATVHFIAMEKVDGQTLRQILAREAVPARKALEWVAQVADAVAAAHSVGVIHRDLKPENIMIASAGYAKVLDFGLAKLRVATASDSDNDPTAVRSTETGVVLGTAGYMSPEQAQGKDADHRTDIFSLGCILYELASGKRAFRGESSVDTLHKIIYSEPEPLPRAPAELQRIVRKAIAKDPDERYQSARDFAVDLRALLRESAKPTLESPRRRVLGTAIVLGAALIAVIALAVLLFRRAAPLRRAPAVAIQQLTARGNVIDAQISPDGRFMAFVVREERGQGLWLKQLATSQELQLIPPTVGAFWGSAFTRDGNAIVYGLKTAGEPRGALYRVSTIGGHPERLLAGTDSAVSFSPDGKKMTWIRAEYPRPGESALMIANDDGTGERVLATRRPPELFAPIFFARPSWSPDGNLIAASVRRTDPVGAMLIGVDPQNGRETVISNAQWWALGALEWLPDGSGVVAVATRQGAAHDFTNLAGTQIWLIPYPSGEPRRITNDASTYRKPSISADGTKLVAVVADQSKVHLSRIALASGGPPERFSTGRYDGVVGVTELGDGRIVFTSAERGGVTLWIVERDGTGRRQLLRDAFENRYPVSFTGGIAYVSTSPTETDVCLINAEGENRRVIVRQVESAPIAVSQDGKSIVYSLNRRLWMISSDGTARRQLTQEIASNPAFSPRGDRIAFVSGDTEQPEGGRLVVAKAAGDKTLWSASVTRQGGSLRWLPDGNSLLLYNFDTHNISIYPLRGDPKRLMHFDDFVWDFDIAHDGKSLIVAQGSLARDAVLITGFR